MYKKDLSVVLLAGLALTLAGCKMRWGAAVYHPKSYDIHSDLKTDADRQWDKHYCLGDKCIARYGPSFSNREECWEWCEREMKYYKYPQERCECRLFKVRKPRGRPR